MDGRTDRQKWSSYYSTLHCEQCGCAVKTRMFPVLHIMFKMLFCYLHELFLFCHFLLIL